MHRLELKQVGKRYGRLRVFRDINVQVESGQVLVIAGHNGSGKSTLLRIIAGLDRATAGEVHFWQDGQPLSAQQRRRNIGLVAVDVALYGELSAHENLAFFARVRDIRLSPDEMARLLDAVGLTGRGEDLVQTYSSGMRQRLKYACALLHRPPLLLLDEPGATLDESGIAVVQQIIARQRARGMVVLATNDPRELDYGDAVLRLGGEGA